MYIYIYIDIDVHVFDAAINSQNFGAAGALPFMACCFCLGDVRVS